MLLSIAYVLMVGMAAGWLCRKLHLPSLAGMILTGIVLGPYVLDLIDGSILGISAELRKIALIIILILSYGSGMFLATIGVFFRDIEYLWSVALMLIMYTCAIFYYPSKLLKSGWAWILKFNPLYCTIQIFRSAIFGEPMYAPYVIYAAAFSVVITIIGLVCFKKKQDNFILYI